ncbi:MAG TPA: hypothetical protein VK470_20120, partial [Bacteroidota bacterium]|nr:hypothetical protein [Bacteroidota bacterium]
MIRLNRLLFLVLFTPAVITAQSHELRIITCSPRGATSSVDQSLKIVVVFSEPMSALTVAGQGMGRHPFTITPAVAGTFHWIGTTTCAFTPADT